MPRKQLNNYCRRPVTSYKDLLWMTYRYVPLGGQSEYFRRRTVCYFACIPSRVRVLIQSPSCSLPSPMSVVNLLHPRGLSRCRQGTPSLNTASLASNPGELWLLVANDLPTNCGLQQCCFVTTKISQKLRSFCDTLTCEEQFLLQCYFITI